MAMPLVEQKTQGEKKKKSPLGFHVSAQFCYADLSMGNPWETFFFLGSSFVTKQIQKARSQQTFCRPFTSVSYFYHGSWWSACVFLIVKCVFWSSLVHADLHNCLKNLTVSWLFDHHLCFIFIFVACCDWRSVGEGVPQRLLNRE